MTPYTALILATGTVLVVSCICSLLEAALYSLPISQIEMLASQGRVSGKILKRLGAVVGNKPLPRTQVTKKIWAYIKKSNLQDTQNKRMINGDDKLKAIFGGKKQVSMFEMTKLVNKHMK